MIHEIYQWVWWVQLTTNVMFRLPHGLPDEARKLELENDVLNKIFETFVKLFKIKLTYFIFINWTVCLHAVKRNVLLKIKIYGLQSACFFPLLLFASDAIRND